MNTVFKITYLETVSYNIIYSSGLQHSASKLYPAREHFRWHGMNIYFLKSLILFMFILDFELNE